ncbi:hypothetical protein JCM3770_006584 [Rhodotorula araucariae]
MSSDGYDLDPASDEEFVWSGDDLDDGVLDTDKPAISAARTDSPAIPAALDDFRLEWTAELIKPRPSRPPAQYHPVLANPDILDIVLADAQLADGDLRTLALVDTPFCHAAQKRLFHNVTIPTLNHARRFALVLAGNPALASYVQRIELSLADYRAMVQETPEFRRLVTSKRTEEDNEEEAWYYDKTGHSVSRMPWMNALYRKLGEGTSPEVLEAARSRSHLKWALEQLGVTRGGLEQLGVTHAWQAGTWPREEPEDGQASNPNDAVRQQRAQEEREREERLRCRGQVARELRDAIATWPFDASADASATEPLLAGLFRLPRRLTLSFPLSHCVLPLASTLSTSTNLRHLCIMGQEEQKTRMQPSAGGFVAGPAVLRLRADRCAFDGAPSSLTSVTLDSMTLRVEGANDPLNSSEADDDQWQPEHIGLWHVLASWVSTAVTSNPRPLALVPSVDRYRGFDPPSSEFGRLQNNYLCLDLFSFLGQPALTSLTLVDVSGVIPSTIYRAIQASGPTLRSLELVDINCRSSRGSAAPADYILRHRHVFPLAAVSPRTPASSELDTRYAAVVRLLDTPARALDPVHLSLAARDTAHTLVDALRQCRSLRRIRLETDRRYPASPYMPTLLDALLAAAPPLETLVWRVGVPSGRSALGARDWAAFACRLGELKGATGGALDVELSEVWVAVPAAAVAEPLQSGCSVS